MSMNEHPKGEAQPVSLDVFASTTFRVQLSDGIQYRGKDRLDLEARVDPDTGEVRLFVDKTALQRYLDQQ